MVRTAYPNFTKYDPRVYTLKLTWAPAIVQMTLREYCIGSIAVSLSGTDDIRLSDADRSSYEKIFSSILVPYTALTVGEEIGQGGRLPCIACMCIYNTDYI